MSSFHGLAPSHVTSNSASISTAQPKGRLATLTAERAWRPLSPRTVLISSDAPLMICVLCEIGGGVDKTVQFKASVQTAPVAVKCLFNLRQNIDGT